jgi:diaminobutyrate-2-oxoglutarate transaminase
VSLVLSDPPGRVPVDQALPDHTPAGPAGPAGLLGPGAPAGASEILDRQKSRESSARTYARSFPIVPVRAAGMVVTGADGRTYLDCLSGAGTLALGHNHPVVVAAIRRVLDTGAPLQVLDVATPEKDAFVETLFDLLPKDLARDGRIHFAGPTGADAVEAAIKLTQTATGRRGLLAFTGAYHGMTTGALAMTGSVAVKAPVAGIAADVTRLPFPYDYRCPFGVGGAEGAQLAARYTESLLADENGGVVTPAAMLVEAVQGEGGVVPAPDAWLREMRRVTADQDIPLVVDEVQTGLGRTGALWAVDHAGITPDVMVFSKAIGGGMPLAVVIYRAGLDVWEPGAHTGTFRGNQLALAAGAATMRYVAEHDLASRAGRLGVSMLSELHSLAADSDSIGDVRGRGLMLGIELVDRTEEPDCRGTRPADPDLARRVRAECLRRGLIVELGGRRNAVVRLLPPLVMTDAQADSVLNRLAEALTAAERAV